MGVQLERAEARADEYLRAFSASVASFQNISEAIEAEPLFTPNAFGRYRAQAAAVLDDFIAQRSRAGKHQRIAGTRDSIDLRKLERFLEEQGVRKSGQGARLDPKFHEGWA